MNGPLVGPLLTAGELAAMLEGDEPPTVLDVRWSLTGPPPRVMYDEGHLRDAAFVDLDYDLADPPGAAGRHPLPDPVRFETAMRRCGVSARWPVIVYDHADGTVAARAWWLLRYHGHPDVRVLDGGLRAWTSQGLPVTTSTATPRDGDFTVAPGRLAVLDGPSAAARTAAEGLLLDARAAERYRGEVEPVDPVAGHIPGAVSAPTLANVDHDGRFLPAEELQARFASLGVAPGVAVGVYCGSGVTAAHEVLALELAGWAAALYPGSWSEWVADPSRPVATGPTP